MENRKLELVQELMELLQDEMQPSADDFGERLGRPKPQVEVEIETKEEPMDGEDLAMEGEFEMSPEDKLKERLLKLRG